MRLVGSRGLARCGACVGVPGMVACGSAALWEAGRPAKAAAVDQPGTRLSTRRGLLGGMAWPAGWPERIELKQQRGLQGLARWCRAYPALAPSPPPRHMEAQRRAVRAMGAPDTARDGLRIEAN